MGSGIFAVCTTENQASKAEVATPKLPTAQWSAQKKQNKRVRTLQSGSRKAHSQQACNYASCSRSARQQRAKDTDPVARPGPVTKLAQMGALEPKWAAAAAKIKCLSSFSTRLLAGRGALAWNCGLRSQHFLGFCHHLCKLSIDVCQILGHLAPRPLHPRSAFFDVLQLRKQASCGLFDGFLNAGWRHRQRRTTWPSITRPRPRRCGSLRIAHPELCTKRRRNTNIAIAYASPGGRQASRAV